MTMSHLEERKVVRKLVAQLVWSKSLRLHDPATVPSCMHMYAGVYPLSVDRCATRFKTDNVNTLLCHSFDFLRFRCLVRLTFVAHRSAAECRFIATLSAGVTAMAEQTMH